jgi:acyl-CoA synthetase (AMP-forming)/AMP-acid ligase II
MTATEIMPVNSQAVSRLSKPRLLPSLVDEIARSSPSRPFLFEPRSLNPEDGWAPVTFKELANAVDHVAHIISETIYKHHTDEFPTLCYIGPNDCRYGIVLLAAIKAHCQALFVSSRNTTEGQNALFDQTNCRHFWYTEAHKGSVQEWTRGRQMTTWQVPAESEWTKAPPRPFPFTKTYEEGRFDPLAVMHTSGSTGIPKPVVLKQGSLAICDEFRSLPPFQGGELFLNHFQKNSTACLTPFPSFHPGGVIWTQLIAAIYYTTPGVLPPDQPLTGDLVLKCMQHSPADTLYAPPSLLEEVALLDGALEQLKRMRFVAFSGGRSDMDQADSIYR